MTDTITPKGTHGAQRPQVPHGMAKTMNNVMVWIARHGGNRMVLLTTIGARTGNPHTVALGRFPVDADGFLIVASNGGSPRHPDWFINLAKKPDQVWAEIGGRKFKVRPQVLTGAEREAAMRQVIAAAPNYGAYQRSTDREIPVIRLVPETET
jgi:deazaflavin-dependent oxidoreductase (nitroreductase family)